jgi:hypothetical protein
LSIESRLIEAAKYEFGDQRVFSKLQERSGISAESWRKVNSQKQRSTSQMIEWACQEWPHFAFWISSGVLPDIDLKHKIPRVVVPKIPVDFEKLFAKEPINWTPHENDYLHEWLADSRNETPLGLSNQTLLIYLEAQIEKKLLKQVINQKLFRLQEMEKNPEEAEFLRNEIGGGYAEGVSTKDLLEYKKDELKRSIEELEIWLDKKII